MKALGLGEGTLANIASALKLKGAVENVQGTLKAGAEFTEDAVRDTIQKGKSVVGRVTLEELIWAFI